MSPYPRVQALGVKDILNELSKKRKLREQVEKEQFSHDVKGTVQRTLEEPEEDDERERVIPSTNMMAQRRGLVDQPEQGNEFFQSLRKLQDLQFKSAGLVDLSKQSGVRGTSVGGGRMPRGGKASYGGGAKGAVRSVASNYGWDKGNEWKALVRLVQKESSWNPKAANPTSSARGLFQKMTSLHGAVEKNAKGQAKWGLNYIKKRYGSPSKALAFHLRNNWY